MNGPIFPMMAKDNKPIGTQVDPDDSTTVNNHEAYEGLTDETKRKRQKIYDRLLKYWPAQGTDIEHWFPQQHRPEGLPQHPLDWSTPLLQALKNLASVTIDDMPLAHKHMKDVAERKRSTVGGLLSSRDIERAVK